MLAVRTLPTFLHTRVLSALVLCLSLPCRPLTEEDVELLLAAKDLTVMQDTPLRVLHRRAPKVSIATIKEMPDLWFVSRCVCVSFVLLPHLLHFLQVRSRKVSVEAVHLVAEKPAYFSVQLRTQVRTLMGVVSGRW